MNPVSGAIENLAVLFFSKRLMNGEKLELPFELDDLRLVA